MSNPWTEEECLIAAKLFRDRLAGHGGKARAFEAIGRKLGRTTHAIVARFGAFGANFTGPARMRSERRHRHTIQHIADSALLMRVPQTTIDERDARFAASEQRDLTGILCGDPPPGYRALDRR